METSSVYMCFPCYQEFNTLEEVLKHQLTCTAEEEQPQHVINISQAVGVPQSEVSQIEVHAGHSSLQSEDEDLDKQSSDQPRILYQCGDCDELFKSLQQWQFHRREGVCQQDPSKSKDKLDSNVDPEAISDLSETMPLYEDGSSFSHNESHQAESVDKPADNIEESAKVASSQSTEAEVAASNLEDSSPRRRGSNKKPKPEPVLLCVDCGLCFGLVSELVAHRKTQHGFEEALHRCSVCGESFLNTTLFLYHRKQHRQKGEEKVVVVPEVVPEEVYTQSNGTTEHEAAGLASSPSPTFTQPEVFFCIKCGESCNDEEGLVKHRKEKHNLSEPLHSCSTCGKTFMNTTRYLYHRRGHSFTSGEKAHSNDEAVATEPDENPQSTKRLMSPSTSGDESGLPASKKNRPSYRIVSASALKVEGGPASLLRHSMSHTGNKPFCCDVCGKNFSQSATLKRHQQIHSSLQPRRKRGRKPVRSPLFSSFEGAAHLFSCPNCPSRFSTEEQLNHHKLLHTSHPFPCPDCGEAFKRRKDLDLHSLTHQDKQPATCPHCASQFINQSVLEIHLQRCPTTEEERNAGRGRGQGRGRSTGQIECDLCGHRCMTQEGLDLHRLSHTGQTPLKCPVRPCRRRFTSNSALEEHVLAHFQGTLSKSKNRPRFRCEICHKEFAYKSTFNVHMRTHTDERPFECTTCGKRFRQLPHLQDHMRIHSGARPFCCWICGKSFSVAARLTEHARTHSGEKPYPCPHCAAAFRSRPNLDKHLRLHGELPLYTSEDVLEGAKTLSSLSTVMIPSDQLGGIEGASQVVILPSSVLGAQGITVPTITMEDSEITMVETSQSPQHTIEFIVEETV
uniref:Zinc finger protein 574 n=1 Tax=Oryzias sinensis TaxID=183150 RepID=A0A8C8DTQ6_9TELE